MQYSAETRSFNHDALAVAIAALAAGLAASLLYTPLALVVVLGVPAAIYFATRPYELLLFMVFMIPFNFVFKVGPLPVAFEVVKILAWIPFWLTRKDRPEFIPSRFKWFFVVLAAVIVTSLLRAHDRPFTLKECVRLGSNVALVYLCINLVDSREKVMQIFRVLTVSTLLVALYGFYQWMIQDYGALFWIVNPRLDTSLAHYRDYFWEWRHRIISVLTSEMELGHYFNLCIPIAVVLWLTEGRKQFASKWFIITACLLLGLVLTFTFGSWLALAGACGFTVLFFGGRRKARLLIYSSLALIAVSAFLAFGPLQTVIEDKISGNAIGSLAWDAATRLYGWKLALQAWWSHPLIGVGIGNFEFFSADYDFVLGAQSLGSSPHETFLYLLANYGLIGTAAVVFIIGASIRSGIQVARTHSRYALIAGAMAFAIAANLIGWLSDDSTYLGPHTSYLLWLFVGLIEAVRNLQSKDDPVPLSTA